MPRTAGRRTAAPTCSIAASIDAPVNGTAGDCIRARLRARLARAFAGAFRRQRSASPRRAAAPAGRGEPEGARRSPWQVRVFSRRAQRAARSRRAAGRVALRNRPHARADRGPRQSDRDRRPAAKGPVRRHRHALEEARAGARAAGCERREAAGSVRRSRRSYPRRGEGLPGGARPVQARQLPHGGLGDAGLPGDVSRQLARAQCAVLDRHGLLRAARLQKRDRRAAQAPHGVARQPEGARRDAEHRKRAGNDGRPPRRAKNPRRPDRALSLEQRRDEREAAPGRLPEALNEPDPAQLARLVTAGAFLLAFIFGAVGNKTRFCTMGAVSDWVNMGDLGRMRMWLLAIAVALLGSSALQLAGVVDLSKSIYPGPNFTWLSYVVGGFLFGVGMTLGSGCGSKTLIRIGAGGLTSVIVYVFLGIAAYMTLRGLLGAFRVGVLEKASLSLAPGQDLPSLLSTGLGLSKAAWTAALAAVVGGAILAFVYASREFRSSFDYTLGGVVTGLVVVGGWYVSGHIGHLAEDPNTLQEAFVATNSGRMESFSFVSPMAYTLDYLMLWTDKSKIITYGIASAAGVIAGSAAYALATRTFRWEGFRDAEDTASHIIGGMLMGFGGICALGCTIGQAISGVSTLALGSIITFVFIVLGSAATMKLQYWRIAREG